jgi:hypothetical protein
MKQATEELENAFIRSSSAQVNDDLELLWKKWKLAEKDYHRRRSEIRNGFRNETPAIANLSESSAGPSSMPSQNPKPYVCPADQCESRFKTPAAFMSHVSKMHGDQGLQGEVEQQIAAKPFGCGSCDMSFNSAGQLKSHVLNKHAARPDIKPFYCKLCQARFTRKDHLQRHGKSKHPGMDFENAILGREEASVEESTVEGIFLEVVEAARYYYLLLDWIKRLKDRLHNVTSVHLARRGGILLLPKLNAGNQIVQASGLSSTGKKHVGLIGFSEMLKKVEKRVARKGGTLLSPGEAYSSTIPVKVESFNARIELARLECIGMRIPQEMCSL